MGCFLGSNHRQQTNDEENPETQHMLSNKDKENDSDGGYIFGRKYKIKINL